MPNRQYKTDPCRLRLVIRQHCSIESIWRIRRGLWMSIMLNIENQAANFYRFVLCKHKMNVVYYNILHFSDLTIGIDYLNSYISHYNVPYKISQ